MENQLLITMIIISSCFFIGSLILDHGRWVIDVVLRGGAGMIIIGLMNSILSGFGCIIPVGVNLFNFVVVALLGFPGVAAIYAIGLWQLLG